LSEDDIVCQSCGMPLDEEDKAYTSDGERSDEFCKFCYAGDKFADPNLTIENMAKRMILTMKQMNKSEEEIIAAAEKLPTLKRWKGQSLE